MCFMGICILFSMKPPNIKLSSLHSQHWLFIDANLLIFMPSWLYSILFLWFANLLMIVLHACCTGMWQVAGGHGKINPKKAVEDMKLYAFAGLGVFDMADICEFDLISCCQK